MGINIIREEIRVLLDTINEQYAVIESYKGSIPKIELDILQANFRKIYECLSDLEKVNGTINITSPQKTVITPEVHAEKEIEDASKPELTGIAPLKEESEKPVIEKLIPDPPLIKEEPKAEVVIAEKPVEKSVEAKMTEVVPEPLFPEAAVAKPEVKKPDKKEKKQGVDLFAEVQKTTVADSFKTEQKPLYEKLSQDKNEKPLVEKIKQTAVKDLKSSIGINERFLFINELFKGNMQQYNSAIEQLNSFEVATDAFALLESLKAANGWENKAETYGRLEEFVMRKFLTV